MSSSYVNSKWNFWIELKWEKKRKLEKRREKNEKIIRDDEWFIIKRKSKARVIVE